MDTSLDRHRRKLCGHCNEMLSYSAYRSHKDLYYDQSTQTWVKEYDLSIQCHDKQGAESRNPEDEDLSELIGECDATDSDSLLVDNLGHLTDTHDGNEQMEQDELLEECISDSSSEHEDDEIDEVTIEYLSDDDDDEDIDGCADDFSKQKDNNANSFKKIIHLTVNFLLIFRVAYNIPDQAIVLLLKFFRYLIAAIVKVYENPSATNHNALPNIPLSIQGCYSLLGLKATPFRQYTVCPSCHLLYNSDILLSSHTRTEEIKCTFVEFPNHPQARFRLPCDTRLFDKVQKKHAIHFKSRKIYYYYGIKHALENLTARPKFLELCNQWAYKKNKDNFILDITDGKIWLSIISLLSPNQMPMNILGILMNVDWFQPFKHVSYSVGIVYAVIINLPRSIRYANENIIFIGIIPGPKEPSKHINSYLGPFVSELLELYNGLWFTTPTGKQFIKCVLMGLSSDIPATRKAAGFVGHNATKACSRCLKNFSKVGDFIDCSGFDRDSWPKRTHTQHCEQSYKTMEANTKDAKASIEKEFGVRYSVLFELPYYDAIRFSTIDAMHNLFLGTAKHVMTLWKDRGIITKDHFKKMQERIEKINVPLDIGRIPHKVESSMASLTADQWKNWTCIYSLYVLHNILPSEHLNCWWLFVQASILICHPILSNDTICKIDELLLSFCKTFERLYGNDSCTINIHLHCHLAECLRDYGPTHDTWCFSFERLNGILGRTPNNKHTLEIEKTLITRFIQQMESNKCQSELSKELESFFKPNLAGSVYETHMDSEVYWKHFFLSKTSNLPNLIFENDHIEPIGKMYQHTLNTDEVVCLQEMYQKIFEDSGIALPALGVSCLCYKFNRVKVSSKLISSKLAKSDRSSYVCAKWLGTGLHIDHYNSRPGTVNYFLKHKITLKQEKKDIHIQALLAYVSWYKVHEEKNYLSFPVTIWSHDVEPLSFATFIPISRILCRCAQVQENMNFVERPYNNGKVTIIIPTENIQ